MAHTSRAAARRHRRKLASGWRPPPLEPVELLRRGRAVEVERTPDNMRRDLFEYDGDRIVSLTALARAQGYRFP